MVHSKIFRRAREVRVLWTIQVRGNNTKQRRQYKANKTKKTNKNPTPIIPSKIFQRARTIQVRGNNTKHSKQYKANNTKQKSQQWPFLIDPAHKLLSDQIWWKVEMKQSILEPDPVSSDQSSRSLQTFNAFKCIYTQQSMTVIHATKSCRAYLFNISLALGVYLYSRDSVSSWMNFMKRSDLF